MHVLFFHSNYPAQFGPIAHHLAAQPGHQVSFATHTGPESIPAIRQIRYKPAGGATQTTHYCSRTFENAIWHSHAVFDTLAKRPDIQPDLIVGHSGFGTTVFLRELFRCPIINYFEYYYHTTGSDMDFRPEFPVKTIDKLRARARNAAILLDLVNCDAAMSPTRWQRERFPSILQPKMHVIFDGIDTQLWKPQPGIDRRVGNWSAPAGAKIVTYVARGFESMRGFDIFMKVAKLLCLRRPDVHFLVVGQDRVCYGGDEKYTSGKTFKEWVLAQDQYDLSRFSFIGTVPPTDLARILAFSDLHIYLTVPFVLSWSLMNALACGAIVLASNTSPVREMITHGQNGLLGDFYDSEGFADQADRVLRDPAQFAPLRTAAAEFIRRSYSLDVCLPQVLRLYEDTINQCR